jgi:hypothetical protein
VTIRLVGYSLATPEVLGPERYRQFCEGKFLEQLEGGYGCIHCIVESGQHVTYLTQYVDFFKRVTSRPAFRWEQLDRLAGDDPSGEFDWWRLGWPDEEPKWISGGWPIQWRDEGDP